MAREEFGGYGAAATAAAKAQPVDSISLITKLNGGFNDSAFGDNKTRPIHRWIPWIAGFSSEFVRDVFSQYLPTAPRTAITVLDPFCGVGTTLVEGMMQGYDTDGFESRTIPVCGE